MAYLGNRNATGENNSFKILDDLAFTTTFNGSDGNVVNHVADTITICLLYTSPSPRDSCASRMPSSA